jgi:hypothetical protein
MTLVQAFIILQKRVRNEQIAYGRDSFNDDYWQSEKMMMARKVEWLQNIETEMKLKKNILDQIHFEHFMAE